MNNKELRTVNNNTIVQITDLIYNDISNFLSKNFEANSVQFGQAVDWLTWWCRETNYLAKYTDFKDFDKVNDKYYKYNCQYIGTLIFEVCINNNKQYIIISGLKNATTNKRYKGMIESKSNTLQNKQQLYESIMRAVSKVVKKHLTSI